MASRTEGQTSKPASPKPTTKAAATRPAVTSPATATTLSAAVPAPHKKSAPESTTASTPAAIQLTPEERARYVAEAAYYIAERRGFVGGNDHDDWLQAESEIDRLLAGTTRH